MSTGNLHFVIDGSRVDIQRPAEQIRETQNVIHLIGVVAAPGCHNCIRPNLVCVFGCDLRIGVRHSKDHRVVRHTFHHGRCHGAFDRYAQEDISTFHGLFQSAQFGRNRVSRLPLVHAFGPALINNAFGVTHDAVLMPRSHGLEQLKAGDSRRAGSVKNDPNVLDLLPREMQRIDKPRSANYRCSVLVVMKDGNVHLFLEALLDDETLRGLNVLKVDPAKGRPHQPHSPTKLIRVFGIELDVDGIHIGKTLEQNRLAFHHRLGAQRPQISQTQNSSAV